MAAAQILYLSFGLMAVTNKSLEICMWNFALR